MKKCLNRANHENLDLSFFFFFLKIRVISLKKDVKIIPYFASVLCKTVVEEYYPDLYSNIGLSPICGEYKLVEDWNEKCCFFVQNEYRYKKILTTYFTA